MRRRTSREIITNHNLDRIKAGEVIWTDEEGQEQSRRFHSQDIVRRFAASVKGKTRKATNWPGAPGVQRWLSCSWACWVWAW
jgi:hypothetical protein